MFTRENITKLHELSADVRHKTELSSEGFRTIQDRYKHREVELERDGKMITLTEKTLWDEVYHLGTACQAGKILQEKYPDEFANLRAQDQAAAELRKFCMEAFEIDYLKMSLSDYIKMTEGMFKVMLEESKE